MPRIAGVDIPKDKRIEISLRYIYGIGPALAREILEQTRIDSGTKAGDLTEEEVNRLRDVIDHRYTVEGELRKELNLSIKRLIEIGSYRGIRHRQSLPARGQRTRTNARTKRGARQTVPGRGQRRGMTKK
ncbi:MAG: 30S ribosomal protein S13 [Chloroflexi bacterium]|nr:30S ribosomal protein S13 [Chloroflexota bacterium]